MSMVCPPVSSATLSADDGTMESLDVINQQLKCIVNEVSILHRKLSSFSNQEEGLNSWQLLKTLSRSLFEVVHSFSESEKNTAPQASQAVHSDHFRTVLVPSIETPTTRPSGRASSLDSSLCSPNIWSGFYNKTLLERRDVLSLMFPECFHTKQTNSSFSMEGLKAGVSKQHIMPLEKLGELPIKVANLMVENCIGVLGIPLGLGLNFIIDGQPFVVPMAVEEPSVIAAASSAAKLVKSCGDGFHTFTSGNVMTAQVQFLEVVDPVAAIEAIHTSKESLLEYANTHLCSSMKRRGGGALDIWCREVSITQALSATRTEWYQPSLDELYIPSKLKKRTLSGDIGNARSTSCSTSCSNSIPSMLVVHIEVDVCEAMGANVVNTVAEGLSAKLLEVIGDGRCGLRILTNLNIQRRTRATFSIPVKKLAWKGVHGDIVADKIVEACQFGVLDPFRACTNNKGIMNGVDAVAIATGQDWRAIEAAAHCYASRSGQYTSLSYYEVVKDNSSGEMVLTGTLELPLAVGTKGGALQTHPGYKATHQLLDRPSSRVLAGIITSVGLAQNFAALRALAVTGIQQGHMKLHARNIAVAAGAPSELVPELCAYMINRKSITTTVAKDYLQAHELFAELSSSSPPLTPNHQSGGRSRSSAVSNRTPSIFFVEIPLPDSSTKISINVAYEPLNGVANNIIIMPDASGRGGQNNADGSIPLNQKELLGDKGFSRLQRMIVSLRQLNLGIRSRTNTDVQNKLNLISILLNVISRALMRLRKESIQPFFQRIFQLESITDIDLDTKKSLFADMNTQDALLSTGAPLFLSLLQVFQYILNQQLVDDCLRLAIQTEQRALLCMIADDTYKIPRKENCAEMLRDFMASHAKKWQGTIFLLIDSLSLDSISEDRLLYLKELGNYVEWEGMIAHDIARCVRAYRENETNACLFWFKIRNELGRIHANEHANEKHANDDGRSSATFNIPQHSLKEFKDIAREEGRKRWQNLRAICNGNESKLQDLYKIEAAMEMVRNHYEH